jgi:hypothetical protein
MGQASAPPTRHIASANGSIGQVSRVEDGFCGLREVRGPAGTWLKCGSCASPGRAAAASVRAMDRRAGGCAAWPSDARLRQVTWPAIEAHRDYIVAQLKAGVAMATVCQRPADERGLVASVRRYVAANLPEEARRAQVRVLRLDPPEPGQEAQVDYGQLGRWVDPATGRRHVVNAFATVLCCSRLLFVRPVIKMDQRASLAESGLVPCPAPMTGTAAGGPFSAALGPSAAAAVVSWRRGTRTARACSRRCRAGAERPGCRRCQCTGRCCARCWTRR